MLSYHQEFNFLYHLVSTSSLTTRSKIIRQVCAQNTLVSSHPTDSFKQLTGIHMISLPDKFLISFPVSFLFVHFICSLVPCLFSNLPCVLLLFEFVLQFSVLGTLFCQIST